MFIRTTLLQAAAGAALAGTFAFTAAQAQDTVKIGLILPMTGGQSSTGKQIDNAVKLYMQQHGDTVAGKKIEVILKDDATLPDNTKRLAQELIVNDKVNVIAGFGITPSALAAAPLATQAKVPEIVMAAGTSIITERSPYIARTSFTLGQSSIIIGDWAAKNGIKKVATLTSDYAPGNDALKFFKEHFTAGGGEIVEEVKAPLANPDFDRPGHARHRAEHLHPQGREEGRRTLQRRIPNLRGREGSGQDEEVIVYRAYGFNQIVIPGRECLRASPESITTTVSMDSGPAPEEGASQNDGF